MAISEVVPSPRIGAGLEQMRRPLTDARHLPGYIYTSPEILQIEKEKMFMRDWLIVAREEEFEKPGDFITYRILGEPLIVARAQDGTLNAYANVCVHRGVEVAAGSGNTKEFMCPYHGWLYDLKGKLIGAPYMKEASGFDPKNCTLPPVRLATWGGFVFVCFSQETPPFEQFAATFIRETSFLHPERCRLSGKIFLNLDCNWKLLIENVMDHYHAHTLHGASFGWHTSYDKLKTQLFPGGGMKCEYASGPLTPNGKSLFGKLPWFTDKPDNFAMQAFMMPNTYVVCRADQVRVLISWPVGPDKCHGIMYSLFPKEHFEAPDFKEKADIYHAHLKSVLEEDSDMVRSLQHAMTTRTYKPGPMAPLEESIHHVVNGFLDRIFEDR